MLKKIIALMVMVYAATCVAAVEVNKANAAELDSIKGIGPAMSSRILEARKKGDFKDWNDFLSRVKGVKRRNASKLSDAGLTVGGASFSSPETGGALPIDAKLQPPKASAGSHPK